MKTSVAWYVALLAGLAACGVAGYVMFFGFVDIQEGNTAWLRDGPERPATGDIAARTLWGVAAMALSPLALVYLVGTAFLRSRFADMTSGKQWMIAVGIPLILVTTIIGLCILGSCLGRPIVISYPD